MEYFIEGERFEAGEVKERPATGFKLQALTFVPDIEDLDGALMDISGYSPVFKLVDEDSLYIDKPITGEGTVIVQYPDSATPEKFDLKVNKVENGVALAPSLSYAPGTIFAYVGDLRILGVESKKWFEEQELEMELDDPRVPSAFRELMLKVIERNSKPLQ